VTLLLPGLRGPGTRKRGPLFERFWRHVLVTEEGCWGWIGASVNGGYGVLGNGSRKSHLVKAHRVSWMIHFGAIPKGMHVLHHCDNRPCTNPAHLFLGTDLDNQRDAKAKGRHVKPPVHYGADNHRSRVTPEQVRFIRHVHAAGKASSTDLAWLLNTGITPGGIKLIVNPNSKSWRYV